MSDERFFTSTQAATANTALREALGLPPEHFGTAQFVAMISDEIEQLREAGHDDAAIAALVERSTGGTLSADEVTRFYAPPEARGWSGNGGGGPSDD